MKSKEWWIVGILILFCYGIYHLNHINTLQNQCKDQVTNIYQQQAKLQPLNKDYQKSLVDTASYEEKQCNNKYNFFSN